MAPLNQLIVDTLEHVKNAHAYLKERDATQPAERLMQAREALQEIREGVGDLSDRFAGLEDELEILRSSLRMKAELVRHQGVYWTKGDRDPWCPHCWEHEQRSVHMNPTAVLAGRLCECQRCSYSVNIDNVSPPKKWPKRPS